MRLAKHLAHAGVASRRASERLIGEGRVTVGGEIVRDPARDVSDADAVAVDGELVGRAAAAIVVMLNKPAGVVSTAHDPQGRPTVVSVVGAGRRLYPVGRLDRDATGLILLTDDGDLAQRVTHPSFEVPRRYRVRVGGGRLEEPALRALRDGVELEDGPTAPARVRRISAHELELTIHEGRNHQVKRMCAAVGHPVRELQRVGLGPLRLGGLGIGEHRELTAAEVRALRGAAAGADSALR